LEPRPGTLFALADCQTRHPDSLSRLLLAPTRQFVIVVADATSQWRACSNAFLGTPTEEHLAELCRRYQVELQWHHGFRMRVEDVPRDFRGPTMPSLAERICRERMLDVRMIGVTVRDLYANPDAWKHRGTVAEVLQELKLLWHVLVRCGATA
jgi:Protein of unknown function (DUF3626)